MSKNKKKIYKNTDEDKDTVIREDGVYEAMIHMDGRLKRIGMYATQWLAEEAIKSARSSNRYMSYGILKRIDYKKPEN